MGESAVDEPTHSYRSEKLTDIYTKLLQRNVEVEIMTPATMDSRKQYPLLILNDGQDSVAVKVKESVEQLVAEKIIPEIIVVGITAADRMQEYGVGFRPDYFGRGKLAKAYSDYIITELVPYLRYKISHQSPPLGHTRWPDIHWEGFLLSTLCGTTLRSSAKREFSADHSGGENAIPGAFSIPTIATGSCTCR
ncbi:MAG: alpha/beta hydrolase-fold protein [Bacteroidota bacterium]